MAQFGYLMNVICCPLISKVYWLGMTRCVGLPKFLVRLLHSGALVPPLYKHTFRAGSSTATSFALTNRNITSIDH